ncbi:MAG: SpoIIE family protein phosphatase [Spirochaetia bacterium]|jgi:serine phosphatase RsbU (regulator of sigma subunit)|nr:SpoIIE family protein phosphatase [Spirochaetia bacterium]
MLLAVGVLGAQQVDLTTIDAYVRPGFSLEWVFQTPMLGDESWTIVPANTGNRPLLMRNLDLPGSGTRSIFSLVNEAPQRYCVMIPFVVKDEILISKTGVGLYLAQIGQNWQIYLNGYLVRDETYTAGDGTMRVERAVRGALIELDTRYLKKGKNLLTIMVAGDPGNDGTGLSMGGPYLVDSYDALESLRNEGLKLILIGIYFFFGLYHAILFMLRPKAKAYLYYGLATGLLSIYLFCRTFIVYEIILDTRIIKGLELSSLFLLVPAFMAFFDSVRAKPVSLFAKLYGGLFALVAVLRFFFWSEAFLRLWQYSIVLPILYIFIVDIGIPIVRSVRDYRGSGYTRFWRRLLGGLRSNDATKLLVGTLLVGSAVMLDIVGLNAGRAAMYSDYAYLLLVFGTAATLAGQIVKAYRDSETLGADLARRVEARTKELEATLEDQDTLSVSLSETSTNLQAKVEVAAKDMRVATRVQQGFFPGTAPQTDAWDCAFSFIPASGISGDFYDFFTRGDRLDGLVVGDVSGHGIASGLITVLARSIFHRNFYERKKRSLGSVLESINEELIPELSAVDNFITTALLRLDPKGGVEYSSAAHTEILYRGAGKVRAVPLKPGDNRDYKGPPLGREGLEAPYTSIRFAMKPGDVILIYTDGFDEAKNVDGQAFGIDGMLGALTSAPEGDAAQMLDFMVREWRFHVSGTRISDDATAILLKMREETT